MKKLLLLALMLFIVTSTMALDIKVSSEESQEFNAQNAIDGDKYTRWSSEFSDSQWFILDLGKVQQVSEIVIFWESAHAKRYTIKTSNDEISWKFISTVKKCKGGEDHQEINTSCRYIRVEMAKRATEWGYSVWELTVLD